MEDQWIQIDETAWLNISKYSVIKLIGSSLICFIGNEKCEYPCNREIFLQEMLRVLRSKAD